MARQPGTTAAPIEEPNLPVARVETDQQVSAQMEAHALEQGRIHQIVGEWKGRRQMAEAFAKFGNALQLLDLQRVKEAKEYKGLKIERDGKVVTVNRWDEFCEFVIGRSREAVDLELKNLSALGVELYDAFRAVGFGPATMRDYRALPADDRAALTEAAESGNKDAFLELAESLIAKHQRDKQLLEERAKNTEAAREKDKGVAERLLAQKNEHAMKLEKELAELKADRDAPPDWDRRATGINIRTTVCADRALKNIDMLHAMRERIVELGPQCGDAPYRAMAVQYMDCIERMVAEMQALANHAHEVFGTTVEAAALEAADYRLSDLPTVGEMVSEYIPADPTHN
jgi:hypothetical protein